MAETMPYRPTVNAPFAERPSSLGSNGGSKSSTFSQPSHHKVSSQSSLVPPSPRESQRTSQRTSGREYVRPAKRLKSQYPLDSPEPHVEYILVASFDIDRGPIMEHQFPGAISPDENMLAELMLPDQTHMRQQDWTMFFLHKDAGVSEEELAEREATRRRRESRRAARAAARTSGQVVQDQSEDDDDSDDDSISETPPLMYVLNLVNTKQDATVKRGAVVKAMAICTRHSFLHIYKPLLLLALEDYMKSPNLDTLELLYNALNSMDASLMPRLSKAERHILQSTDSKEMFVEKFEQMVIQRQEEDASENHLPESPTRSNGYSVPRDTHELETKITFHGVPIPVKIPTALSPETVGDFSLIKLVQTFGTPHQTQPQPFALHPHLTSSGAYTHPILVLINAMLTQKRVIFLGHNMPSGDVAEAVLAACALASGGVLSGFTRHAFPYTDLTKIDELLKVPGFIAGVTNPAFSYHPEWWDLLCDLPTGRMKISSSIEAAPVTEGSTFFHHTTATLNLGKDAAADPTGDTLFMEEINRAIVQRHGEPILRARFRAYITKFTRVAAAFEEVVYGASALNVVPAEENEKSRSSASRPGSSRTTSKSFRGHGYVWPSEEAKTRELAASAARIEGWRNTRSYYSFISDLANHLKISSSPTTDVSLDKAFTAPPSRPYLDIYHSLSKLRVLRLTAKEAGAIYLALEAHCTDYASILELLELTPMSEAGLFYVALGLWHEDVRVREAVAVLLERVRSHPAGKVFYKRLGGWTLSGHSRALKEMERRAEAASQDSMDVLGPLNGEAVRMS
ncbi:Protein mesA [Cyphellophora attinorum]|uniref:Protein mesA n=1 Tax=Cyphellophora attinorum TaxID=1664694 RepID=A0A0N0NRJ3_9EURO|nr:Protein mesA [Phialophora attinorum]KPI45148.1 Protein mesA [Phialophora attinorum]